MSFLETFRGHQLPGFDIVGQRRRWFAFSGALIALSLVGVLGIRLEFSIDFEGGALISYPDSRGLTAEDVQATLAEFGRSGAEVQVVGGGEITIRTSSLNELGTERTDLLDALAEQAGSASEDMSVQDVGPTWGGQISRKAFQGLIIFLVLVSIYVAFRFEWKMAVAAQAALAHDLIVTAGIYGLVGREVTPATVIAILTILGYSLYDTVVIFDRIKEHTVSTAMIAKESYAGVVSISLNETFMRSVNTSLATLLPITALLLFGGTTLKDFAFALFVGVLSSTYSSLFVASPVLAVLKEREPRYRQVRARIQARQAAGRTALREVAPEPAVVDTAAARATTRPTPRGRPSGRRPPAKRKRR
ncbi:MAG TPA: protein translocase subunit SecF [Actinomycetota bacterium]|nr:protein translocase subunit SecF [Actinomycetota bacterium]